MKEIPKFIFVFLMLSFLIFIIIFISSKAGYYEYSNNSRKNFTEEKMAKFEEDVKNGKNVKIEDYLDSESIIYDNNVSKLGDNMSKIINKSVNFILESSFKAVEKMID